MYKFERQPIEDPQTALAYLNTFSVRIGAALETHIRRQEKFLTDLAANAMEETPNYGPDDLDMLTKQSAAAIREAKEALEQLEALAPFKDMSDDDTDALMSDVARLFPDAPPES